MTFLRRLRSPEIIHTVVGQWAHFGGGHGGRVPLTFLDGGDIICHVSPTFFSYGLYSERF